MQRLLRSSDRARCLNPQPPSDFTGDFVLERAPAILYYVVTEASAHTRASENMKAAIIVTKERRTGNLNFRLRSGGKGTGKVLQEVISWDNGRAMEEAARILFNYAARNGITVTPCREE